MIEKIINQDKRCRKLRHKLYINTTIRKTGKIKSIKCIICNKIYKIEIKRSNI